MKVGSITGPKWAAQGSPAMRTSAPQANAIEAESRPQEGAVRTAAVEQVQRETATTPKTPAVSHTGARIRLDNESNRLVVQFLDEKNQVVKQIPMQELLEAAARMKDLEQQLFDEQA